MGFGGGLLPSVVGGVSKCVMRIVGRTGESGREYSRTIVALLAGGNLALSRTWCLRLTLDLHADSDRAIRWRVDKPTVAGALLPPGRCAVICHSVLDWFRTTNVKNIAATQNQSPQTNCVSTCSYSVGEDCGLP